MIFEFTNSRLWDLEFKESICHQQWNLSAELYDKFIEFLKEETTEATNSNGVISDTNYLVV